MISDMRDFRQKRILQPREFPRREESQIGNTDFAPVRQSDFNWRKHWRKIVKNRPAPVRQLSL